MAGVISEIQVGQAWIEAEWVFAGDWKDPSLEEVVVVDKRGRHDVSRFVDLHTWTLALGAAWKEVLSNRFDG